MRLRPQFSTARRSSPDPRRRGGDLVAYHRRHDGSILLAVGDVAAKEQLGTTVADQLGQMCRYAAHDGLSPRALLRRLNRALIALGGGAPSELFASAFAAVVHPRFGSMIYAAAGTDGALVFDAQLGHHHLRTTGPLLGLDEDAHYTHHIMALRPGDLLVVYTDGVTEAPARRGSYVGTAGVVRAIRDMRSSHDIPSSEALWEHLDAQTGGWYQDDATLALIATDDAIGVETQARRAWAT